MSMINYRTPCYVIDADVFEDNLAAFRSAFQQYWEGEVAYGYSIKTNHDPAFLKLAGKLGMYAEAVSDDEYHAALFAGYASKKVIFNGPQKSSQLLEQLFATDCIINLDHDGDLLALKNYVSGGATLKAKIGVRVNFDMESCCPGEMTAGAEVSRFGFCVENGDLAAAVEQLQALGIPVSGLHMHYSSKSRSERVFRALAKMAVHLVEVHGLARDLCYVDMGGGFFYGNNVFAKGKPTLELYARVITEELKRVLDPASVALIMEPGASLISSAVTYYTRVLNQRFIRGVNVLTADGSRLHIDPFMTGRTPLYEILYGQPPRQMLSSQILCGSTCMENDRMVYLTEQREVKQGDVLVCHCAGAYTMGFNSCFINLPPYVYLKTGDHVQMVRDKNRNLLTQI